MSTTLKISDGDIDIDQVTGLSTVISGPEKTSQDVANVLMINRRQPSSSRSATAFNRAYGNEIADLKTPTLFGNIIGKSLVAQKIQEAIRSLMELQDSDPNITDDERIQTIGRMIVESTGATDYIYYVETILKGSTRAQTSNLKAVRLEHQYALTSGAVEKR